MRDAAAVAYLFRLDPVAVLDEVDPLKRLLRLAAHNAVQDERNKAQQRQPKT